MKSKITDEEARKEVSRITNITLTGRMYAKTEDYMQLTRVKEMFQYLKDSNFSERVIKNKMNKRKIIGEQNKYHTENFTFTEIEDDNGHRLMMTATFLPSSKHYMNPMSMIWSEMMFLLSEIGFSDKWLVEIYPPKDKIIDNDDVRHFWIIDEPNYGYK